MQGGFKRGIKMQIDNREIKQIVEQKGLDWLVGAMIEGSIGYHSVISAENMIKRVLKGKYTCCERTLAIFDANPVKEIKYDIRIFKALEQQNPEKVKRIIRLVKHLRCLNHIQQTTFGLMYPTLNI